MFRWIVSVLLLLRILWLCHSGTRANYTTKQKLQFLHDIPAQILTGMVQLLSFCYLLCRRSALRREQYLYIHILLAYCIIMSLVDAIACGNSMKKIIFDEAQRILCLLVTKTTSNHWMLLSLSKLRMQKYYFFVCHFCGNKTTLHEQL